MSLLVDRVMGEAGFCAGRYAALALKQCEGCVDEAVFLLRAYRSTLTRNYYSEPVNTRDMRVVRRISSAFKDIPGGQILGATYDYTHRLLDFSLERENGTALRRAARACWRPRRRRPSLSVRGSPTSSSGRGSSTPVPPTTPRPTT
jgi:alpha-D-ribose 1-methylphosphonate 5-triphosphate synthase subunit PhnI